MINPVVLIIGGVIVALLFDVFVWEVSRYVRIGR